MVVDAMTMDESCLLHALLQFCVLCLFSLFLLVAAITIIIHAGVYEERGHFAFSYILPRYGTVFLASFFCSVWVSHLFVSFWSSPWLYTHMK